MQNVRQIADDIVSREGGYVNDRDDPGGATNYGVTIHTMRRLGLDLDQDGDVDVNDVKRLTKHQAVDIFLEHYFKRPGIAGLPFALQANVFDMYVNSGNNAVKILQRLVNKINSTPISVDGGIGPITRSAVQRANDKLVQKTGNDDALSHAYAIERRNYYYNLAHNRVASRKYAKSRNGGKGGWIKRAEEFLPKNLHLSNADHQRITSRW